MNKKLYKSNENRMLEGVCGGIAEFFGIDATLVRLGFVLYLFLGMNCITIVLLGGLLGFLLSVWRERRKGGPDHGTP